MLLGLTNRDEGDEHDRATETGSRTWLVGDWHVHPWSSGGTPSATDVQGWRLQLENGVPYYCGVIVTEGERGWTHPEFHGWVVTPDNVVDAAEVN